MRWDSSPSSGGALRAGPIDGQSVPKPDASANEGQKPGGVDPPPASLGHRQKLEDYEKTHLAGTRVPGHPLTQAHRREHGPACTNFQATTREWALGCSARIHLSP
jgi:hypothetical protein